MKIIRGQLAPFGVALPTRWNADDQVVETSTDGGETWNPDPAADRRQQYLQPHLTTEDPRCDAAANVTVAIHEEIDAIIAALNAGADVLTLGTGFVEWLLRFSFPGWVISIVLGVMAVLLDAGAEDIDEEFTSAVYDDIQCYFYCAMNADGVLTETALNSIAGKLYSEQSLTVYNVLTQVFFYTMGWGGLTDAAAMGSETGDCGDCGACSWVYDIKFADAGKWDYFQFPLYSCNEATLEVGAGHSGKADDTYNTGGWLPTDRGGNLMTIALTGQITVPAYTVLTEMRIMWTQRSGGNLDGVRMKTRANNIQSCRTLYAYVYLTGMTWSNTVVQWFAGFWAANAGKLWTFDSIRFTGTGANPFLA